MPVTEESGKDGKVLIGATSVGSITRWTFRKSVVTSRFASSETAGKKKTIAGVGEGSGSIDFKFDTSAVSPILEGTGATLLLHLNATDKYTVPAVIKDLEVTVDIDDGTVTGGTANFETNGAWTEPTLS